MEQWFLFIEMGLQTNSPLAFLTLRLFCALLIMTVVFLLQWKRVALTWRQTGYMAATGVFLQGFYQVFAFAALAKGISPGLLAIVLGAQPIATAIITRQALSLSQASGLVVGLIGLTLTVSNLFFIGVNTMAGVLFSFLSLLGITLGTILQKKYCSDQPLSTNLFIQYCASFLFVFVAYSLFDNQPIHWSESFIIALAWMVLVISIASTFLFYYLLKNKVIVNFTSYLYCVPPVTALMDYFIFHHALSQTSIVGMLLVLVGLSLVLKTPVPMEPKNTVEA